MAKAILTLVQLCLMTDPLMAQEPTVTSLMAKELTDIPGKDVLMITVDYAPGVVIELIVLSPVPLESGGTLVGYVVVQPTTLESRGHRFVTRKDSRDG
jgi:hypothetical protein